MDKKSYESMNDDIFDVVLKHALYDVDQEMENETESLYDMYKDGLEVKTSLKFRWNMKRLLWISQFKNIAGTKPKPSLAFAMSFVLCLSLTFVVAEANDIHLFDIIFDKHERYTEIRLDKNIKNETLKECMPDWNTCYVPTKIPLGYTLSKVESMDTICTMVFTNEMNSENIFEFTQSKLLNDGASKHIIDTEDAYTEEILISGRKALYIKKNNWQTISFYNNTNLFRVTVNNTQIKKIDLVNIAESIELL